MKQRLNKKGFTLTELIIVMVIIAILAVLLVPNLMGYVERANDTQDEAVARGFYQAAVSVFTEYLAEGGTGAVSSNVFDPADAEKNGAGTTEYSTFYNDLTSSYSGASASIVINAEGDQVHYVNVTLNDGGTIYFSANGPSDSVPA